jgi:pimeloyl-ACP methyl ester carboxylesterase
MGRRGTQAGLLAVVAFVASGCLPPEWGAAAILHPYRRAFVGEPDLPHEAVSFRSDDGLLLRGWLFRAQGARRGLIVYLHGIADNRRSGVGLARRYTPQGYDVLVYDSRAHGASEGTVCTYGFYEKRDLSRALDVAQAMTGATDAIVFGSSLGAAVALQAAAIEPRIRAVVAQSPFADLETVIRDRAPFVATRDEVARAIALAESEGRFRAADVSPCAAAALIHVPVLLIHGAEDHETPPVHSRRIYEALTGPRRFLVVPGAGHNDVLGREEVWQVIGTWLAGVG